ncbi:MAG: response regulator transcription factor, partial [Chloroflexi bacterium]|nr:response regulator transcription factor [Chloroflexota bacterium]
MGARVLVIDDEPEIRQVLRIGLAARGYVVETAAGGNEGLDRLQRGVPDVVVLDLMMPDLPGADVIRQIRMWCSVPVIVLSVRTEEQEKVRALDLGADDYLTKPFGMEELVARIRVALRHAGGTDLTKPIFCTGELAIDFERRQVLVAGHEVAMTPTEYSILKVLAQHAGKVLTHRMLLQAVWGPGYGTETNYLHVYI